MILKVHYTENYPDELPEFELHDEDGKLERNEKENLLEELRAVVRFPFLAVRKVYAGMNTIQGQENLGMAMTFTLVTHLREQLSGVIRSREERRKREEAEKERRALEVCIPRFPDMKAQI